MPWVQTPELKNKNRKSLCNLTFSESALSFLTQKTRGGAAGRALQGLLGSWEALPLLQRTQTSDCSHLIVTPALGKLTPSSGLQGTCTHGTYSNRYTHTTKGLKINPNLIFKNCGKVMDMLTSLSVVIISQSICLSGHTLPCIS